jgi:hypothetical protein
MSFVREQVVKRFGRSSGWAKVRKTKLIAFPFCAVCNKKKGLEAHHIKSFKNHPELELDPTNLKILCRRHHFAIGHLEYWKAINNKLEETIVFFKNAIKNRKI